MAVSPVMRTKAASPSAWFQLQWGYSSTPLRVHTHTHVRTHAHTHARVHTHTHAQMHYGAKESKI